jgi:hypothetical protein
VPGGGAVHSINSGNEGEESARLFRHKPSHFV